MMTTAFAVVFMTGSALAMESASTDMSADFSRWAFGELVWKLANHMKAINELVLPQQGTARHNFKDAVRDSRTDLVEAIPLFQSVVEPLVSCQTDPAINTAYVSLSNAIGMAFKKVKKQNATIYDLHEALNFICAATDKYEKAICAGIGAEDVYRAFGAFVTTVCGVQVRLWHGTRPYYPNTDADLNRSQQPPIGPQYADGITPVAETTSGPRITSGRAMTSGHVGSDGIGENVHGMSGGVHGGGEVSGGRRDASGHSGASGRARSGKRLKKET